MCREINLRRLRERVQASKEGDRMRRAIIFTLWLICVTGYIALLLYDFRLAGLAMAVLALFAAGLSELDADVKDVS